MLWMDKLKIPPISHPCPHSRSQIALTRTVISYDLQTEAVIGPVNVLALGPGVPGVPGVELEDLVGARETLAEVRKELRDWLRDVLLRNEGAEALVELGWCDETGGPLVRFMGQVYSPDNRC
jgi:hypothetical protein